MIFASQMPSLTGNCSKMIFSTKSMVIGANHHAFKCGSGPCRTLKLEEEMGLSKHYRRGLPRGTVMIEMEAEEENDLLRDQLEGRKQDALRSLRKFAREREAVKE